MTAQKNWAIILPADIVVSSKTAQKSNLSFVIFDELTGKRVLSRKGEYASESQRIFNGFLYDCATAMPFKNNYKGYNESS